MVSGKISDIPPVLTVAIVVVVVVDDETNGRQVGGPEMKTFKSTVRYSPFVR